MSLKIILRPIPKEIKLVFYKIILLAYPYNKRIVIGSSRKVQSGWVSINYPIFDITKATSFNKILRPGSVTAFMTEHVLEHLSSEDAFIAMKNCHCYLKKGGYIRIAVPDGFHNNPEYIESVKPGGYGPGSDDHKVLYNYKSLSNLLKKANYEITLLEWFDEDGKFHFNDWIQDDGFIKRSSRYDPRNNRNSTLYTSLIIDALKK